MQNFCKQNLGEERIRAAQPEKHLATGTRSDGTHRGSVFHGRLVHQHDRNVVLDGIYPAALSAFQAFGILAVFERLLAGRAN